MLMSRVNVDESAIFVLVQPDSYTKCLVAR